MTRSTTAAPPTRRPSVFDRLGGWAYRRRWFAVVLWVLVLAGVTVVTQAVGSDHRNDFSLPGTVGYAIVALDVPVDGVPVDGVPAADGSADGVGKIIDAVDAADGEGLRAELGGAPIGSSTAATVDVPEAVAAKMSTLVLVGV
ncbi:hypothetical protein ACIBJE_30675 [Micromonospora sp. NPDC050187]|uniref:hypothetical protein n=1 Tax=Micromonospora sp. NPDC050187 TaxID=3364277 RepID=UPI0037A8C984